MNAPAKIETPTGLALLRQPFPDHHISKLPKESKAQADARKADRNNAVNCKICGGWHHKNAVHLDYVGHAALTDRLLDADPEWNWEPVAFGPDGLPAQDRNGGMWIKLTVCGQTRLGYGHADGKQGGDAIKEVIGDAMRNAAMRFGAALDLWHKGDLHIDDEPVHSAPKQEDHAMPDHAWAKLVQLVEATKSDTNAMCAHYKVKSLRDLKAAAYDAAIDALEKKLAKLAKEETDAKAGGFGKILNDEIPEFTK